MIKITVQFRRPIPAAAGKGLGRLWSRAWPCWGVSIAIDGPRSRLDAHGVVLGANRMGHPDAADGSFSAAVLEGGSRSL